MVPTIQLGMRYRAVGTNQRNEGANAIIAIANEDNTIVSCIDCFLVDRPFSV